MIGRIVDYMISGMINSNLQKRASHNHSKFWFVADLVDVVVEQLIDEVDMRQEHPPTAIAIEAQLIQDLAHIYLLSWIAVLVTFSDQQAELLPLVRDYLPAAEATNRDDHLLIIIKIIQGWIRFESVSRGSCCCPFSCCG